jgi:HTH-type transcriptional repressor of NAD biosynthesis genes
MVRWSEVCANGVNALSILLAARNSVHTWWTGIPANAAPDDVHRDFVALLCTQVLKKRVDAVFTSEPYGPGFAAVLTRRFAEAGSSPEVVAHVNVDLSRAEVPISGTALRRDPWTHWHYLPRPVAATLVRRIVFLGGESSGKSTLSAALAREFETVVVPEYARELWDEKSGKLEFGDMVRIAREQTRREEAALTRARGFVFCDTSPLTTLFYSRDLFGRADPELVEAADRRYDVTVLCAPDFPHVQDGTRRDPPFAEEQHAWYVSELQARGVSYLVARGSLNERINMLRAALGNSGVSEHASNMSIGARSTQPDHS